MRLYAKLALLVVVACAGQSALSSGIAGEAYFTMRCFVAHASGDQALEGRLVSECEAEFVAARGGACRTIALNAAAPR